MGYEHLFAKKTFSIPFSGMVVRRTYPNETCMVPRNSDTSVQW